MRARSVAARQTALRIVTAAWAALLAATAPASLRVPAGLDTWNITATHPGIVRSALTSTADALRLPGFTHDDRTVQNDIERSGLSLFPATHPPRGPFSLPRVIADDRFTYTYDWEGRTVAVAPKTTAGQPAPERVEYTYDGLGRLLTRTHKGAIPAGGTDNDRPFIDGRTYTWEGASLAAEAGLNFAGLPTWRRQYLPGPSGLDDTPQVRVEAGLQSGSPTTTVFDIVRDEMGSVIAVAEDRSSSGQSPRLLARFHTSPYGTTHVELGPELLEILFDGTIDHVGSQHQRPDQVDSDNAPGALVIRTTLPLDPASLVDGLLIEEKAGNDSYRTSTRTDFTIGTNEDAAALLVIRTHGWLKGTSYRITLKPTITDGFGRTLRLPAAEASGVVVELPFGDDGSLTKDPKREFPLQPEEDAAANTLNGAFPGGINILHQGLWTDPTTGIAYARNRWYDPRNASWLSEDPAGDTDSPNLYAFVGWRPQSGRDPMGLAVSISRSGVIVVSDENSVNTPFEYMSSQQAETDPVGVYWTLVNKGGLSLKEADAFFAEHGFSFRTPEQRAAAMAPVMKASGEFIEKAMVTTTVVGVSGGIAAVAAPAAAAVVGGGTVTEGLLGGAIVGESTQVASDINARRFSGVTSHLTSTLYGAGAGGTLALAGEGVAALRTTSGTAGAPKSGMGTADDLVQTPWGTRDIRTGKWSGGSRGGTDPVDDFVEHAIDNGYEVVGREIDIHTPFGTRRADLVLRHIESERIGGIEIKSSLAEFNKLNGGQFAKDRFINMFGGRAFGANAEAAELSRVDYMMKIMWGVR